MIIGYNVTMLITTVWSTAVDAGPRWLMLYVSHNWNINWTKGRKADAN